VIAQTGKHPGQSLKAKTLKAKVMTSNAKADIFAVRQRLKTLYVLQTAACACNF